MRLITFTIYRSALVSLFVSGLCLAQAKPVVPSTAATTATTAPAAGAPKPAASTGSQIPSPTTPATAATADPSKPTTGSESNAPGAAETPAADGTESVEQARALFNEGVKYYDEEQYDKARIAFLATYKLKPHPAVLLNVAQSELLAGMPADAANHFQQYLRETKGTPNQSPEARTGFDEAITKAVALEIACDEADAVLTVDGVEIGKTPLAEAYYVLPGAHSIEAKKGNKSTRTEVTGNAGEKKPISLTLATPPPKVEAVAKPVAPAQPQDQGVSRGRKPFIKWFAETPVAWVGAGVTGLGLGSSLIFALASSNRYGAADDTRSAILSNAQSDSTLIPPGAAPCGPPALDDLTAFRGHRGYSAACQQYTDQVDSAESYKTVSIIGLVLGIAAAGGTVGYYYFDPKAKEAPEGAAAKRQPQAFSARVIPVSSPTTQGVSVVGTF